MELLLWKVRVSALWMLLAIGMSAVMLLALMEPGMLADVMAGRIEGGQISTEMLLLFSLFWLVPMAMSFFTLALDGTTARYANAVMGPLAAILWLSDVAESVIGGAAFSAELLVVLVMVVIGAAIAWHAWQWPVRTESTA